MATHAVGNNQQAETFVLDSASSLVRHAARDRSILRTNFVTMSFPRKNSNRVSFRTSHNATLDSAARD